MQHKPDSHKKDGTIQILISITGEVVNAHMNLTNASPFQIGIVNTQLDSLKLQLVSEYNKLIINATQNEKE